MTYLLNDLRAQSGTDNRLNGNEHNRDESSTTQRPLCDGGGTPRKEMAG